MMTRVKPFPSDVVAVPVTKLRRLTRRAGLALFLASADLLIGATLIVLLVLYLGGRRAERDAQDARTQQLIAQSIYEARVGICEALRAQGDAGDPNGGVVAACKGIPGPGVDPDGPGPLRPAPGPSITP